jgi:hypothetical protein
MGDICTALLKAYNERNQYQFKILLSSLEAASGGAACKQVQHDVAVLMIEVINELRSDEGSSVTIMCDNPDFNGAPDCMVECAGEWTDWQPRRFYGDTLDQALAGALGTYRQRKRA